MLKELSLKFWQKMIDHKILISIRCTGYLPVSVIGWAPANEDMMLASREIFEILEGVLDISFDESNTVED